MRFLRKLLIFTGIRRDPNYVIAGVTTHKVPLGGFVIPQPDDGGPAFVAKEDLPAGAIFEVNLSTGHARKAR
jgi:hypothetical protein